jgi:hypothetical protein
VVKDISSPVLPDVAIDIVWHPNSLLSKASRTFMTHAVRLAAEDAPGIPQKT